MQAVSLGIFGGLAALILLSATAGCAFIVTERLVPRASSAVRWCGIGVVWTWILVAMFFLLGSLGAFRLRPCLVILPGLFAVTWLLFGRRIELGSILRADVEALARAGRMMRASRWLPLYSVAAGALILTVARVVLAPPIDHDSLTYHLFIAGQYIQAGGFFSLHAPDAWQYYSYFPANGEILSAWLMLPFHGDLLAHWGNLGYWLIIMIAFHALARIHGITSENALLGALVIAFMPTVFSYIPTSYVEIRLLALCLCGTLFLSRWLQQEGAGNLILAFGAFGIAAGIKLIALPVLGVALVLAIGHALAGRRYSSLRNTTGWIAVAVVCAAVVSVPWYARAWRDQGSWTYPFSLVIGGHELVHGSPQLSRMLQARYDGDRSAWSSRCATELRQSSADPMRRILVQARQSILSPWARVFLPDNLTMGPAAILLILATPWALAAAWRRGPRWPLAFAVLAWAVTVATYLSKEGRAVSFTWPTVSPRMLTYPAALMLVWVLVLMERKGPVSRLLWTGILILITASLVYVVPAHYASEGLVQVLNVAFLITVGVLVAWSVGRVLPWQWATLRGLAGAAVPALFVLIMPLLAIGRDHFRNDFFAGSSEMQAPPVGLASAWSHCDDPARPRRIAFAAGWDGTGHNWMWYPLLGRHLQNHVTYVPITSDGRIVDYQLADQVRAEADYAAWLRRLANQGIDTLVCYPPATIEQQWANEHPNIFRRVPADKVSVYEISLEKEGT